MSDTSVYRAVSEGLNNRSPETTAASLVRVAVDLDGERDPWSWLEATGDQPQAFIWSDPRWDEALVAWGCCAKLEGGGGLDGEALARRCETIGRARIDIDLRRADRVSSLPMWLGGFAFDGAAPPARDRIFTWPSFQFVLPEVLIWRQGVRTVAVLHLRQRHGEGVASVAKDLATTFERIVERSSTRRSPVVPAARWPLRSGEQQRERWTALVARARRLIADERAPLQKVVLAHAQQLRPPAGWCFDVEGTLRRLRERGDGSTTFAVRRGAWGDFVGATPELLLRQEGGQIETVALAGTATCSPTRRQEISAAALAGSEKDGLEHATVVNAVQGILASRCRALTVDLRPQVRRFGDLLHLETRFRGELASPAPSALVLASRLHPTPAVNGTPRERALRWIRAREGLDRGWFAGAIGWLDAEGGGHLVVALRSALIRGSRAWAFAGAGINALSDPLAEWSETQGKLETILGALGCDRRGPPR